MEEQARERCIEDGLDPDFVGTKGFPNWQLYTDAERERIQAFLNGMAEITGVRP